MTSEWSADSLAGSTILVTGGSGRVGRHVLTGLQSRGCVVRTVVLPDDPQTGSLEPSVQVVVGSLSDPGTVDAAVDGVDAVIHLAALMDWSSGANRALFEANVTGTFLLMDACARRASDLRRFVLASSDEVYPALEVDGEIIEDLPSRPYSFYGLTKQLDEDMANFYVRALGLPTATARFSLTAMPQEILRSDGWSGRLFFARGLSAILDAVGRREAAEIILASAADPDRTLVLARDLSGSPYEFQFCDVRDLVAGLMCLLTHPRAVGGTFNLSGPGPTDYGRAIPLLASATGQEFVDLSLPGPRLSVTTSTARARDLLGFQPRYDFDAVLAAAIES
ncbi:MAG: NAD-dependent epimerase/dehydratase family protein [Actinomycetales bacterium]|nr:NAD-dependent epimerase/dehydratase family protein [Actinomycetales bacterium]